MIDIKTIAPGLKMGDDGIWYGIGDQAVSYPQDGNKYSFTIEDKSFWFHHRNDCIETVISQYPPPSGGAIFDVGGGNGFVSAGLARAGYDVVLVEPGSVGARNGQLRGLKHVICATTTTAGFKQETLPAIGLFDVLEHIEDDLAYLVSLRTLMKRPGRLYLTVPAYQILWSDEDELAGHYRRYTRKNLCDVIEKAGFDVEFSTYFFRFLPFPIAMLRSFPYWMRRWSIYSSPGGGVEKMERDHAVGRGDRGGVPAFLLRSEIVNLKHRRSMSYGGSCLVVAASR